MRTTVLIRYCIKFVSSAQLKEIAENCGRATFMVSPGDIGLWNISVCLKDGEIEAIRKLGYSYEKIPG